MLPIFMQMICKQSFSGNLPPLMLLRGRPINLGDDLQVLYLHNIKRCYFQLIYQFFLVFLFPCPTDPLKFRRQIRKVYSTHDDLAFIPNHQLTLLPFAHNPLIIFIKNIVIIG